MHRRLIMKLKLILAASFALCSISAFSSEIPKEVIERHRAVCPSFGTADGEYLTKEIYTLPGSEYSKAPRTLYLLGCEMYAYNSMEKAYIVNSYGEIASVVVADIDEEGGISATSDLMGAGFDKDSLTLGTFQKGRGVGDCGSSATYKYNPRSEKFVLLEARAKFSCDGDVESDWPIVYKK